MFSLVNTSIHHHSLRIYPVHIRLARTLRTRPEEAAVHTDLAAALGGRIRPLVVVVDDHMGLVEALDGRTGLLGAEAVARLDRHRGHFRSPVGMLKDMHMDHWAGRLREGPRFDLASVAADSMVRRSRLFGSADANWVVVLMVPRTQLVWMACTTAVHPCLLFDLARIP